MAAIKGTAGGRPVTCESSCRLPDAKSVIEVRLRNVSINTAAHETDLALTGTATAVITWVTDDGTRTEGEEALTFSGELAAGSAARPAVEIAGFDHTYRFNPADRTLSQALKVHLASQNSEVLPGQTEPERPDPAARTGADTSSPVTRSTDDEVPVSHLADGPPPHSIREPWVWKAFPKPSSERLTTVHRRDRRVG